ncbi:MAG: hypothetical protein ACFFD1_06065, partial [Candidatus Thorarchaeota archaeon]
NFFNSIYPNTFKLFFFLAWILCSANLYFITKTFNRISFTRKFKTIFLSFDSLVLLGIIFILLSPLSPHFENNSTFIYVYIFPAFSGALLILFSLPQVLAKESDMFSKTGKTSTEIFLENFSIIKSILSSVIELFLITLVPLYGMAILLGSIVYGLEYIGIILSIPIRFVLFIFLILPIVLYYIWYRIGRIRTKITLFNTNFDKIVQKLIIEKVKSS